MRNFQFENEHFYHVYNRGVDKRNIFIDESDRNRFIKSIIAFNDINRVEKNSLSKIKVFPSENPYVKIHAFCLMNNHFHLLLEPLIEKGVQKFMHRLSDGYSKYFNIKHERSGSLFEGRYKAKWVDNDVYLQHLLRYIHLNPLDLMIDRKDKEVINWEKALTMLEYYPWSSHRAYLGAEQMDSVTTDYLSKTFQDRTDYKNFLKEWLKYDENIIRPYLI